MADSHNTPYGAAGRVLGLGVPEPSFEAGEEVRWKAGANRVQTKVRAVGGHLYLTNRRLIFAPNRFEKKIRGRLWSQRLVDLDHAKVGSMRFIQVFPKEGAAQRFVVYEKEAVVERLNAAIEGSGGAPAEAPDA